MHVGTDLIKIDRIVLNDSFIDKVLTKEEKEYMKSVKKKQEYVASRFALKEAIIKTFEGKKIVLMNEINIKNNGEGVPVCEYKNHNIIGSISHDGEYAIAFAIRLE